MKFQMVRREEYETLYARQQASMDIPDFANIIVPKEESKNDTPKASVPTTPKVEDKPTGSDWATILAPVTIGIIVSRKKFGDGKITWMDKHKKYLRVAFNIDGQNVEKQFIFPDAFINGFLTIK